MADCDLYQHTCAALFVHGTEEAEHLLAALASRASLLACTQLEELRIGDARANGRRLTGVEALAAAH
jgi:hypothetical protein